MRAITFTNSAASAAQVSWVVDRDTEIHAIVSTTGFLVSSDPSATVANTITSPAATGWNDTFQICAATIMNTSGGLKIPLSKDSKIYVNFSGKCVATLWLEDIAQPTLS